MKFLTPIRFALVIALSFELLTSLAFAREAVQTATFEAAGNAKYPTSPDPVLTPGKLCTTPTEKRYAEGIDYCARNVSSDLKNAIIKTYDVQLGFQIRTMDRGDFKIDHFIPLSIGGANDVENLWPQHKSVYQYSDPVELKLSQLMVAGKLKQTEAVRLIKECKFNLPRCAEIEHSLDSIQADR